eukprot:TRINITY_DN2305_c0_g1_i3.p1 TRINITY_DN2305_c0_g1~~TRINITY_DN2305_c0_g1_i3.p1  ORF type:complete len:141 (+),score=23.96 TRINITY_DN2305_c0_g1_i3:110-532(+)
MNIQQFAFEELSVFRHEVRDCATAIIHTILFNRAFGVVRPVDVDAESFELTFVRCDDEGMRRSVDDRISSLLDYLGRNGRAQITLSFHETRTKSLFLFKQEEKICWEQWIIPFSLKQERLEESGKMERKYYVSSRFPCLY